MSSRQQDTSAVASPRIADYIAIARPDHWFKNVFMLIGVVLAYSYFYRPAAPVAVSAWDVLLGFFATCLIASSNYVINEILDAPTDRSHPLKSQRPIPSGRVRLGLAYVEWLLLAVAGGALALAVSPAFLVTGILLWVMGMVYNVPPLRTKDVPYLDVLSESVNNPLRLALGWFVVSKTQVASAVAIPPLSLLISYWMVGAFFMASKRFAEYRAIGDPERAAAYRDSFAHYNENRLLVSMFFYATAAALFLGVFIIRYRLELILSIPLIAGFFSYYLVVALKPNSPMQAPEKLYRETGLMVYLVLCLGAFVALMVIEVRPLYDLFNVNPSEIPSLWKF